MKKITTSLALAIICGSSLYAEITGENVCFYEHSNYQGMESCFKSGKINFIGDKTNDTFSSVKIPNGFTVEAFEHKDYYGIKNQYTGDISYLGDSFNDKISSLKVYASLITTDGQVIPNFDPNTQKIIAFDITMNGSAVAGDYKAKVDFLGNNKFSAYIETNPYAKVVDFSVIDNKIVPTGARYRMGVYSKDATDYITMPLATTTLADGYGIYKVSVTTKSKSIAPNSVCFYEDVNYQGKETCYEWKANSLNEDLFKEYVGNDLNDTFSSIKIASGMRAVVYPDSNFQGTKAKYFTSMPSLGSNNDKISSLYVGPSKNEEVIVVPSSKQQLALHSEKNLGGSSIYDTIEGFGQKFKIDGEQIKSTDGLCLDVDYAVIKDGSTVSLYPCHGGNNQKWTFTDSGEIKTNLNQNFCLDSTSLGDDSRVVMNSCNGEDNQKWNIKSSEYFNLNTKVQFPSDLTADNLKQYFNVYDKLSLTLKDGYWARNFVLPTGVKQYSEIYITRNSTYGVTLERNGTKQSLDRKTYGFRYVDGVWVLIRVASYYFPTNGDPKTLTTDKLVELYSSYTGIDVVLTDGHWTPEIKLPFPAEEGSDLYIRRISTWGSVVNLGDGNKIELDKGSFYRIEYHNGKWSLVNKF